MNSVLASWLYRVVSFLSLDLASYEERGRSFIGAISKFSSSKLRRTDIMEDFRV